MLLEVREVAYAYPGGPEVLKGASFHVDGGEVVAIVGPNGSGKTTLLLIAAGLLEPSRGEVLFEGSPLRRLLPRVRRRIGLLFQDPDDQLFNPTAYDELAFTLRQLLPSEEEVRKRVVEVAEELNIVGLLNRPPYRLSIGEKRRVALASILVYDPDLLLLDEPTANLSSKSIEEVERMLEASKRAGKAVVTSSHDVEFVARVADRVYVLSDGVLRGGGDARSVLADEELLSLADMKPPLLLQAFKLLGLSDKPPLTIEELRALLREGGFRPRLGALG